MTRITVSIPVPDALAGAARSVAPVLSMVRRAAVRGWIAYRTWGMHPAAPHQGSYALLRARVRGGVRV